MIYHLRRRAHVTEITLDGFFVPDDVAARLASLYRDYVEWWKTTPERRWLPRLLFLPNFDDFVHLTVLREHAEGWIKLLDAAAPLAYNRWRQWFAAS